ncbi:MAG: ion transporter [Gammaproteobacteria bacterium]|nr:ion transporter [Gammaproteobacteria bacterium]
MPASDAVGAARAPTTATARGRMFALVEVAAGHGGLASRLFSGFVVGLIILNVLAVILESNRSLYDDFAQYFSAFEIFSVAVFTVEYFARVWVAPEYPALRGMSAWRARLRYISKPMALIDLLAIAPFYLALVVPIDLRYLRLFRLLRLLKLSHYFDGLHMFVKVLGRELGAIAGALMTLVVLIIISACLMFSIENSAQPGQFDSVMQAIWWSVVTLTTVGYGDITPVTFLGKLVAMIIMLLGICTMALPAGILAAKFTEELQLRRELMNSRVHEALRDGVLDDNDLRSIVDLQEKLRLPPEVVQQLVALNTQARYVNNFCPHCGERLATD